jgi:dolichol-phosphate mannosyltransferase
MRVLVVTPTYNERENLEALATAVLRAPVGADYLIVDDASPDGTGALADQIAAREPRFKVMHRPGEVGPRLRLSTGLHPRPARKGRDAVVTMDGDWSHDLQYLAPLVEGWNALIW